MRALLKQFYSNSASNQMGSGEIGKKLVMVMTLGILMCISSACSRPDNSENIEKLDEAVTKNQSSEADASENGIDEQEDNTIPDTDIYLAAMKFDNGVLEIGSVLKITDNPGYDNQPHFLPDNNTILFTSIRTQDHEQAQSDIYAYAIDQKKTTQLTNTPESEYSPTLTPTGKSISVVRVENNSAQRLWEFPFQNEMAPSDSFSLVFPETDLIGYHAWVDADTAFVFRVDPVEDGDNHSLELLSRMENKAEKITSKIGRSLSMQPDNNALIFIDKTDDKAWKINRYDLEKKLAVEMLPTLEQSEDLVWLDAQHLLMAKDNKIFMNKTGDSQSRAWKPVVSDATQDLDGQITRLAVSPDREWLAFVINQ